MKNLHKIYDELQLKYGEPDLNCVYGGGQENNPDLCLIFMNPTAKNIATNKNWTGIRHQWIGTKQLWNYLAKCNLFDKELNCVIQNSKPKDWTPEFAQKVYAEVKNKNIYITNLAKCTQIDARPLEKTVFKEYLQHLITEIEIVNPKKVILFGNLVSSIVLNKNIAVSTARKQKQILTVNNKNYNSYAVYYPVGNGFFNLDKAIEDLTYIANN